MSLKKWLAVSIGICLLLVLIVAGINIAVDPFSVFGDRIYGWYSFSAAKNPLMAKVEYLEAHGDEYNSYLIGVPSTSSYPVDAANLYWDANFYNMSVDEADMHDFELLVRYLLQNHEVKNILLNLLPLNGVRCEAERSALDNRMHEKTTGESKLLFYGRYAFANLNYAFDKINAAREDTYGKQSFEDYDEIFGDCGKLERDTEYIGNLSQYLIDYPEFASYNHNLQEMDEIEHCMESLKNICAMCKASGVNLTVVAAPVYHENLKNFTEDDLRKFYTALAEVTPYWDFTMSSVSFEPRYFYDAGNMRSSIGEMALARISGDEGIYIPEDFGVYVTSENAAEHIDRLFSCAPTGETSYSEQIPILLYHHLTETEGDELNISPLRFAEHLDALSSAGYNTVSLAELCDYVRLGKALPKNPLVITFDDGYLSNYEYAYPALLERGMKASFFPIGISVGKEQYKDTGKAMIAHFSYEQAREMLSSGFIEIQSHTYDMHQWAPFENKNPARETVARFEDESKTDYISALCRDSALWRETALKGGFGESFALAYPQGDANKLAEAVWHEEGYTVTLRTETGLCTVICGLPQSLLGLQRITVDGALTGDELLSLIDSYR